jgi:hypothetical protein
VEARVLLLDQQVFNLLRRARSVDFSYPKSDCWTGSENLKQHSSSQLNAPFAADAAAALQQICFPGFIAFSNIDLMPRVMFLRISRSARFCAETAALMPFGSFWHATCLCMLQREFHSLADLMKGIS